MDSFLLIAFGVLCFALGTFFGTFLRVRTEKFLFDYMTGAACAQLMFLAKHLPDNHEHGARLELEVDRWGTICVTSPPMTTGGQFAVKRKLTRHGEESFRHD